MNLRVATPELVTQRVRSVLKDRPQAEVIAVRAEPSWAVGPLTVDQHRVEVQPCVSPLAVRASLAAWTGRDAATGTGNGAQDLLVLLCDLTSQDLGDDVLARLSPPRVLSLEAWDAARSLFDVQRVDAAFGREDGWIASALLAHVPPDVARSLGVGTTLTKEMALNALARQVLGAQDIGVDAVLEAAAERQPFARLATAEDEVRIGLLAALGEVNGPLGALVAAVLGADEGSSLLAIGLAARAVYGGGEHDGGKAAGRLEARCGSHAIDPTVGAAFAQRAEETVRRLIPGHRDRANEIVAEAGSLIEQLEAGHPEASSLLPAGYDQRLLAAVEVLTAVLDGTGDEGPSAGETDHDLDRLGSAVAAVAEHASAMSLGGRRRLSHLEMAARLTAWLATPPSTVVQGGAASFEQAAAEYAGASAWVDRARRRLWRGDDDGDVAAVYRRVIDQVVERRRAENRRFAELLSSWTTMPSEPEALAPHALTTVEAVVGGVLAGFRETPVLFVVLDGCGLPSFSELGPQFSEAGFREIVASRPGRDDGTPPRRLSAIAALPTVTEVSRASLIAGRLDRGNQDHERRQFEGNAAIKRGSTPAVFFHQNRLLGAAGESLSAEVLKALGPDGPQVVGVVINTIDDQLKRGTFADELRLDDLHALVSLLDSARTHGRVVVVSADHGHVLAQPDDGGTGTFQGGGAGGERWREADREAGETEVLLRGPRVLLGGDAGILAPWEDDYRYSAKAGGYHGGATPEEVLVPVAVFLPAGIDEPTGWEPFTEVPPLWWDLLAQGPAAPSVPKAVAAKPRKKPVRPVDDTPPMFKLPDEEQEPSSTPVVTGAEPVWLDALLASDVWAVQKRGAGRAALPDERVRAVLTAASRRGGVISFAALAMEAGVPQTRLAGFLASLARVLNVDGYVVLDVDAQGQEARLELLTLGQQFQIDTDGP